MMTRNDTKRYDQNLDRHLRHHRQQLTISPLSKDAEASNMRHCAKSPSMTDPLNPRTARYPESFSRENVSTSHHTAMSGASSTPHFRSLNFSFKSRRKTSFTARISCWMKELDENNPRFTQVEVSLKESGPSQPSFTCNTVDYRTGAFRVVSVESDVLRENADVFDPSTLDNIKAASGRKNFDVSNCHVTSIDRDNNANIGCDWTFNYGYVPLRCCLVDSRRLIGSRQALSTRSKRS